MAANKKRPRNGVKVVDPYGGREDIADLAVVGTADNPIIVNFDTGETFFNEAHDPKNGRFARNSGSSLDAAMGKLAKALDGPATATSEPATKFVTKLKNTNTKPAKATVAALTNAANFYKQEGLTTKRTGNLLTVYKHGAPFLHVKYSPTSEKYTVHNGPTGESKLATAFLNSKMAVAKKIKVSETPPDAIAAAVAKAKANATAALKKEGLPPPQPADRLPHSPVKKPEPGGPSSTVETYEQAQARKHFEKFDHTAPVTMETLPPPPAGYGTDNLGRRIHYALRSTTGERGGLGWSGDAGTISNGFQKIPSGRAPTMREAYALDWYSADGYQPMNRMLRGQTPPSGSIERAQTEMGINLLKGYLDSQSLGETVIAQRVGDLPKSIKAGDVIQDHGFVSTGVNDTLDLGSVHNDSTHRRTTMVIKVPKGAKAVYVSDMEGELLLQAGTKFKVTEVGNYKVELEVIP